MSPDSIEYEISVIIPAFNEERRILPTLSATYDFLKKNFGTFEILIVDDGSSDKTAEVCETFKIDKPEIKLIIFPRNKGKGAAVKEGMLASGGAMALFQDADGATPIEETTRLVEALKQADLVIGSRALPSNDTKVTTIIHRKLLGRIFNFTANLLAVPGILDTQCGFKLFTKVAAKKIFGAQKLADFGFDVEILYLARKMGFKVAEIPVNWHNVPGTKVNVLLDGIKMFFDVFLIKLIHRRTSSF
jgi:dolichyl-phosphate beta-glucosyltransferase